MCATATQEQRAVAEETRLAPNEALTLRLGAEESGIDIPRVQEIRRFEQPARIAGAPPHVLGLTNLRGVIVPSVGLRMRFGLEVGCFWSAPTSAWFDDSPHPEELP